MTLWPRWLDRIYWRWYVRRHPVHTASPTIQFLWEHMQVQIVHALKLSVEECRWFSEWRPAS